MARKIIKVSKSIKVESKTRSLLELLSSNIKIIDGRYVIKSKNRKRIKKVKATCMHWMYLKDGGGAVPTCVKTSSNVMKCTVCGAEFPLAPYKPEEAQAIIESIMGIVDQSAFYSIFVGGSSADTKFLLSLRSALKDLSKTNRNVNKLVEEKVYNKSKGADGDIMSDFNNGSSWNMYATE